MIDYLNEFVQIHDFGKRLQDFFVIYLQIAADTFGFKPLGEIPPRMAVVRIKEHEAPASGIIRLIPWNATDRYKSELQVF